MRIRQLTFVERRVVMWLHVAAVFGMGIACFGLGISNNGGIRMLAEIGAVGFIIAAGAVASGNYRRYAREKGLEYSLQTKTWRVMKGFEWSEERQEWVKIPIRGERPYARPRPAPSHLQGLVDDVDDSILELMQDNYGENITVFRVAGKFAGFDCAGSSLRGIRADGETVTLFDLTKHGHNGQLGLVRDDADAASLFKPVDFGREMELIVVFQYDGHEAELPCAGGSSLPERPATGHSPAPEECFDFLAIYADDGEGLDEIASWECTS
ncbi:MAG: hypothetical protein LBH06_05360 [Rikenellaceae bacterium]|nr:hypothetical protein [Rikenellaceae bacterium]